MANTTKEFNIGDKVRFYSAKSKRPFEGVVVGECEHPDFKGCYCVKITKSTGPHADSEIGFVGIVRPECLELL